MNESGEDSMNESGEYANKRRSKSRKTRAAFCCHVKDSATVFLALAPRRARSSLSLASLSIARASAVLSPGSTSKPFSQSTITSAIWPRRLATTGFAIAMYSNSFVGEPKNSLPSLGETCGETNRSQESKYDGTLSCRTRPTKVALDHEAR